MINIKAKLEQFPEAIKICRLLIKEKGQARFVGGIVRDLICGREVFDVDIATDILPDKVESIVLSENIKSISIGKNFGTITALINNHKIEITTLRKDLSCDGRHALVEYTDNWIEDAQRRDFTVNAMSADLDGNIYDYFGGIEDLKQRKIKFIGNAKDRVKEDFLRILRFFRFNAYFSNNIDNNGLAACIKYAKKVQNISINRFRAEITKILLSDNVLKIIDIMQANGIIPCSKAAIKYLSNLDKLVQKFSINKNELLYLAALLRGYNDPDIIINSSAFKASESNLLSLLIYSQINKFYNESLRENWQKYKQNFKSIILINIAVNAADISLELLQELEMIFSIEIKPLPIKGKDLLNIGIAPGKEMGDLLAIAERLWYKSEFKISKNNLIFNLKNKNYE